MFISYMYQNIQQLFLGEQYVTESAFLPIIDLLSDKVLETKEEENDE